LGFIVCSVEFRYSICSIYFLAGCGRRIGLVINRMIVGGMVRMIVNLIFLNLISFRWIILHVQFAFDLSIMKSLYIEYVEWNNEFDLPERTQYIKMFSRM